MNILIAEDEKTLASVLKEEFELEGFSVIPVSNGKEAMDILNSKPNDINLIILDLLMPVRDGFQVLEEIKNDKVHGLGLIPIMVLSNLGQDEEIKKALSLGATDYFVKSQHPISEVVEKVKKFLEKGKR